MKNKPVALYPLNNRCLEEFLFLLNNFIIWTAEQKCSLDFMTFSKTRQPGWAVIDGSNHLSLASRPKVLVRSEDKILLYHLLLVTDKYYFFISLWFGMSILSDQRANSDCFPYVGTLGSSSFFRNRLKLKFFLIEYWYKIYSFMKPVT